jgi:hypothetical protein
MNLPHSSRPGHRQLHHVLAIVIGAVALVLGTGCTTVQPNRSASAAAATAPFSVGDVVTCNMRIGASRSFTIVAIDSGWLVGLTETGDIQRVFVKDTESIRIWRHRAGDLALRTGTTLTAFVAIASVARQGHIDLDVAQVAQTGLLIHGIKQDPVLVTSMSGR